MSSRDRTWSSIDPHPGPLAPTLAHAQAKPMLPRVRWWRVKPKPVHCGLERWFDPAQSYPGFIPRDRRFRGCVRIFRDLQAFAAHDGSFSMDLPLTTLDEVAAP